MIKLFTSSGAKLKLQLQGLCLGVILIFGTQSMHAQNSTRSVSGFVNTSDDEAGLPGVFVIIKNTSKGVTTDLDGKFTIALLPGEDILEFSFLGYTTQQIKVGNQTTINVKLEAATNSLDEVVVVGYGAQKKLNLTGAVETVRFDGAVNQPVTNAAQLMYGKFSGVQLTQSSGLPGSDASSIVIRGVGTFGSANPLVVIDNIQYESLREFNNLAPSDIESISVLKDASASAIYGARGANGVIVVTTSKGKKGSLSVDYNNYFGIQRVTTVPQYLDAVNYATLRNERDRTLNGPNAPIRYTAANIDAIKNGTSPDQYANTNWADVVLRDAPINNHYLSFSGGSEKVTFRTSLGYLGQEAVVKGKFKTERYSLGLNLNVKMNDWLSFSNVTNAYWNKFKGPLNGADAITGETGIINQFQRSSPTIPVYYSNGQLGFVDGAYQNVNFSYPINNALETGTRGSYSNDNINVSERLGITANIYKGLTFETSGSLILNTNNTSNFNPTRTTYDWENKILSQNTLNSLENNFGINYRLMNENILRYTTKLNNHNFGFMGGHSVIYDRTDGFSGSLQGFPSDVIQEFSGGGVLNPSVSGSASEVAWQSFFGKFNYNYSERYVFDVTVRRDGSSKFGPQNRYGTFPSLGLAWNISNEGFMKDVSFVKGLKLSGTWGKSGNDRIGNYIYEQNYNTNLDYTTGNGVIVPAVALTSLANPLITWETVEQTNLGLDASFLQNRLFLNAAYFERKSTHILYTNFPIPNSIGVTNLAAQNAAGMLNKGLELSLNYRANIGKLKYTFGGNVTRMADNKVTDLGAGGEETIGGFTITRIGQPYESYFGYKFKSIFQTAEEVAGAPVQFGSKLTGPGDIRYEDITGPAGTPDGIVNALDRVVIGNPYPKWIYNFNLGVEFMGFDVNTQFQGLGRVDRILNGNGQLPMIDERNNVLTYWTDRWTVDNPSTTLPRLGGQNNSNFSDFYIQDASFLRMKNIEIGYALPIKSFSKQKIQKLRIFVSGQNVLTFTKLKNFDPERSAGANTDRLTPLYKVFTAGLNIKF